MAIEAELVYRAQDTAGRRDAAYVIQMTNEGNAYQVIFKWGSWECYRNATLTPKTAYVGNSYSIAKNNVVEAMNKRTQRGYELQAHLSRFPNWLPAPYAPPYASTGPTPMQRAVTEARAAVKPPEPEPLPTGRVKHSRRIEL